MHHMRTSSLLIGQMCQLRKHTGRRSCVVGYCMFLWQGKDNLMMEFNLHGLVVILVIVYYIICHLIKCLWGTLPSQNSMFVCDSSCSMFWYKQKQLKSTPKPITSKHVIHNFLVLFWFGMLLHQEDRHGDWSELREGLIQPNTEKSSKKKLSLECRGLGQLPITVLELSRSKAIFVHQNQNLTTRISGFVYFSMKGFVPTLKFYINDSS